MSLGPTYFPLNFKSHLNHHLDPKNNNLDFLIYLLLYALWEVRTSWYNLVEQFVHSINHMTCPVYSHCNFTHDLPYKKVDLVTKVRLHLGLHYVITTIFLLNKIDEHVCTDLTAPFFNY